MQPGRKTRLFAVYQVEQILNKTRLTVYGLSTREIPLRSKGIGGTVAADDG
jgi:hypothetical protein